MGQWDEGGGGGTMEDHMFRLRVRRPQRKGIFEHDTES